MNNNKIMQWNVEDVKLWLKDNNFGVYSHKFEAHGINGLALLMLDEDDMKHLVENIGDRKNLYFNLKILKNNYSRESIIMNNQSLSYDAIDSIHKISGHVCEKCLKKIDNNFDLANDLITDASNLKSEKLKTFVSVFYLLFSSLWSTFMLTVVHDRVPDMQKYPPLPDIILGIFLSVYLGI